MTAWRVWHRMLYSCSHTATVEIKGLTRRLCFHCNSIRALCILQAIREPINSVDTNWFGKTRDFCGWKTQSKSKWSFHPSYAAYWVEIICRTGPTEFSTYVQKTRPSLPRPILHRPILPTPSSDVTWVILTPLTSLSSYQTLMYGCIRASSTEILRSGSTTSIFCSRSRAIVALRPLCSVLSGGNNTSGNSFSNGYPVYFGRFST